MTGPHIWEIRAVRDVFFIALAVGFFWLLLRAQSATIPVLIGFGLAYLADPVLKAAERRLGWSRGFSIALVLVVLIGSTVAFWVLVGPAVVDEVRQLSERLPRYRDILREQYGVELPLERAIEGAKRDPQKAADYVRPALSWIGGIVGLTTYTLIATVITLGVFTITAWSYERLPALKRYFPHSRRERWATTVGKVERVFAGFFRGQLVVAGFTTVVFGIGFFVVGVPYWFVAAVIGGLLSIIPYGQASGWVVAIALSVLEAELQSSAGPVDWMRVLLGPTIVYAIMQSLETFVITPLVQGSSTKLHPVAVMAAVVAGGSLGGIVGVFLAIPFVATGKILMQDILLPRWRRWADAN